MSTSMSIRALCAGVMLSLISAVACAGGSGDMKHRAKKASSPKSANACPCLDNFSIELCELAGWILQRAGADATEERAVDSAEFLETDLEEPCCIEDAQATELDVSRAPHDLVLEEESEPARQTPPADNCDVALSISRIVCGSPPMRIGCVALNVFEFFKRQPGGSKGAGILLK